MKLTRTRAPRPAYGTVLYHRRQARTWHRALVIDLVLAALFLALLTVESWWPMRLFDGIVLAWQVTAAHRHLDLWHTNRHDAWRIENNEALEGMRTSGLFSPAEALDALEAAGPPPGMKASTWHRDMVALRWRLGV